MTDEVDESGGPEVAITCNNVAAAFNLIHEDLSQIFKIKEKDVPTLFSKLITEGVKGDVVLKLWDKRNVEETYPAKEETVFESVEVRETNPEMLAPLLKKVNRKPKLRTFYGRNFLEKSEDNCRRHSLECVDWILYLYDSIPNVDLNIFLYFSKAV